MNASLPGLHHVTAITADAQRNIDFYTGVLGLRLVKVTVNFDDPTSYHLYYGDELGRPGTILTFFAWPGAYAGQIGPPQVTSVSFAVPAAALDYWANRLKESGVRLQGPGERFGQHLLELADPDGLRLELVAAQHPPIQPWAAGPVPAKYAIRGFHGVTVSEAGCEQTAALLMDTMGFTAAGSEENRFRYIAGADESGFASTLDLLCAPDAPRGSMGAGVVHHVAFRTPDDSQQAAWRKQLVEHGLDVTPVIDRVYFHSIYYREPGGVLFEIATDNPGFTIDQPGEQLGTKLMLPPWFEPHRFDIERVLPPVRLPAAKARAA